MSARPVRLLVVSNSAQIRSRLSMLVYELPVVDVYWQIELTGLRDFASWCEPHLVLLAMHENKSSHAAYQTLLPALDQTSARAYVLATPEEGMRYPAPHRAHLDGHLPANPTLHEMAWVVQRCHDAAMAC